MPRVTSGHLLHSTHAISSKPLLSTSSEKMTFRAPVSLVLVTEGPVTSMENHASSHWILKARPQLQPSQGSILGCLTQTQPCRIIHGAEV